MNVTFVYLSYLYKVTYVDLIFVKVGLAPVLSVPLPCNYT